MSSHWLIAAGTLMFTGALVPQLIRTWRRKHADDISLGFIVLVLAASLCNLVYFIQIDERIAASGMISNLVVWAIVLRFRVWPTNAS